MTEHVTDELLEKGVSQWGKDIVNWELYSAATLPSPADVTAAFCVALTVDKKILMVREKRGWGPLGGHREEGESIVAAMTRECLEEGGFIPKDPALFAYRKITAETPVAHPVPGRAYPFPVSYIAYYWATTDQPIVASTEPEILEVGTFTLDEAIALHTRDATIITAGWNLANLVL